MLGSWGKLGEEQSQQQKVEQSNIDLSPGDVLFLHIEKVGRTYKITAGDNGALIVRQLEEG